MLSRRHRPHRHRPGRLWPFFALPMLMIGLAMGVRWWVFTQAERVVPGTAALDALSADDIAECDRRDDQPAELVAVIASQPGRHWGSILGAQLGPDGRWLATMGDDKAVVVWDAADLRPVAVLDGAGNVAKYMAFNAEGTVLATGDETGWVRLHWIAKGHFGSTTGVKPEGDVIDSLAFAPLGNRLTWGSRDGTICVKEVDPRGNDLVTVFKLPNPPVRRVALSVDGKTLVVWSGAESEIVQIYEHLERTGARLRTTLKNIGRPVNLMFSPTLQTLISLDEHGTVRVHDMAGDKERARFEEAGPYLAYSADGKTLAMLTEQGTLRRVDLMDQRAEVRESLTIKAGSSIEWASFAPDLRTLITSSDGTVRVWDLSGSVPRLKGLLQRSRRAAYSVAFAPDGRTLAVGGVFSKGPIEDNKDGGGVQLWDLDAKSPTLRTTLEGHKQEVASLAYSPNGRLLASGSDDAVLLWDVAGGQVRKRTTLPATRPMAWASNSRSVATATGGTVQLWSLSGEKLQEWSRFNDPKAPPCQITGLAFSPDGGTVTTGTRGLTVDLYALGGATPREPRILEDSQHMGLRVAYTQEGKALVTLGADGTLRVWDVGATPPKIRVAVPAPAGTPTFDPPLAVSPGGKMAAVAGDDGTVMVYSLSSGKQLRQWKMPGAVHGLAFAPDGRHLAIANANGTVYILRLENASGRRPAR